MTATSTLTTYTLRPPSPDEVEAVAELIIACGLADEGIVDHSIEEQRANWGRLGFSLADDAWVAVAPDGSVAGYAEVWSRDRLPGAEQRFHLDAHVHPAHRGRGLEGRLLSQMVARAEAIVRRLPPGTPGRLASETRAADTAARQLLEQAGFAPTGHSWTMRRELDTPPPAPVWPEGLVVRTFVVGQDEDATHALAQAAFSDLPDFTPSTLESWTARLMAPGLFKPEFCYLAYDGADLAGAALCWSFPEAGWVTNLVVGRPWRKRGLGLALLQHAFAEFRRTGHPAIELGVDAANATGATRLYERAGMRVVRGYVGWERVIGNW